MSLPDNFWSKVTTTDCLVWKGAVNSKGYACFAVAGKSHLAHRVAWEDANGPIPDGLTIDHLCRVRNCVNVAHMELVTIAENGRRARVAAGYHIGGTCGRGHHLSDENIRHRRGRLECITCSRLNVADLAARQQVAEGKVPARVIREWAAEAGLPVSTRGRLSPELRRQYDQAHGRSAA